MRLRFLRNRSLSFKLFAGTLAALSGYVLIIGILAYLSARGSIDDAYDESLVVNANVLLFLMKEEVAEGGLDKPLTLNITDENLTQVEKSLFQEMSEYRMFRVWHGGKLILSSNDSMPADVAAFPNGFTERQVGTVLWRIYALHLPNKELSVEVGEMEYARLDLVASIAKDLVLPFLLSLPVVALMFWRAIRGGMKDLRRVTRQVDVRSPERMTPLPTIDVPPDILPLVTAINALLARLDQSLLREREVTELAAHELRTPLTAIKLQAQMGLKAGSEVARIEALKGLLGGVERAAHLVEQLLTLTRVEQTDFSLTDVDLTSTVKRVLDDVKTIAAKQGQTLTLESHKPQTVCGNEDLLYLTLINLAVNAIKYSPDYSTVQVRIQKTATGCFVEIIDEGPGIPEDVGARVFERFYRHHRGNVLGSGLGLTIAKRCADSLGAILELHTQPLGKGLAARLTFPS